MKCPRCKHPFEAASPFAVYCSDACKQAAYRKRKKPDAVAAFARDATRLHGPLGLRRGAKAPAPILAPRIMERARGAASKRPAK